MKSPSFIKSLGATCLLAPSLLHAMPVEIARESFEGASGAIGFTTSITQFDEASVATSDFFSIQPNNGTKLSGGTLTGGNGANMFAAEDIDGVVGNLAMQTLTTNAVNIAGRMNNSVRILLAAPGTGPAAGGTQNFYDWSATTANIDFVRVEASIDGGPFNALTGMRFYPTATTLNSNLSNDADASNQGDGASFLTAAFQEFIAPIGTGMNVQVRVVMHTNATSEYICVDNIRVFGESSATAAPVIAGVPGTALVFTEGGAAAAVAPALTVADTDSTNLTSASVVISQNLLSSEDVLAATPSGAILAGDIVYTAATGTLAITRSASLADYQNVLRSVTYRNTNTTAPTTATRQIRFNGNDGANSSNSPIRTVDIIDNITTQSIPFTESFETDGRGTRYALLGRFTIGTALFDRGTPSGLTNLDGTSAILAEDTLLDSSSPIKAVAFNFNTASFSSLTATVRLGALAGSVYDTNDFIIVEASVDGGAFTTVGDFRSTTAINSPLAQDTNNDGLGDGTQLSAAMQDFVFTLPTANTLSLRFRCQSNSLNERMVVDRVFVSGLLIQYSIADSLGNENVTPRAFTVTRSGATTGTDTLNFATTAGIATSPADFTATSGILNFAEGETSKTINVPIINESLVELSESFTVTISNPSRGTITDNSATGTITNDDAAIINITGASAAEGDSGTESFRYSVSLTNPVDTGISFNGGTLASGTATAGSDFSATSGMISIAANTTTGTFFVNVIGDQTPESSETIISQFSALNAGGRNVTFNGSSATLDATATINNDDLAITALVNEGSGKRLNALGIPNSNYQFQYSDTLTAWTNLGAVTTTPNTSILSILDPGPLPPKRFYRMLRVP